MVRLLSLLWILPIDWAWSPTKMLLLFRVPWWLNSILPLPSKPTIAVFLTSVVALSMLSVPVVSELVPMTSSLVLSSPLFFMASVASLLYPTVMPLSSFALV